MGSRDDGQRRAGWGTTTNGCQVDQRIFRQHVLGSSPVADACAVWSVRPGPLHQAVGRLRRTRLQAASRSTGMPPAGTSRLVLPRTGSGSATRWSTASTASIRTSGSPTTQFGCACSGGWSAARPYARTFRHLAPWSGDELKMYGHRLGAEHRCGRHGALCRAGATSRPRTPAQFAGRCRRRRWAAPGSSSDPVRPVNTKSGEPPSGGSFVLSGILLSLTAPDARTWQQLLAEV